MCDVCIVFYTILNRLRNKVFHTRADQAMAADHVKNNVSMYHYGGSVDHASFLSGLDLPGV